MTKNQIRKLKSHYQARWAVMRHNQKNVSKILLLEDQIVLKNLIQGSTVCYNCLGNMYNNIIESTVDKKCNNLVLINNIDFKYKTVDEINNYIESLADKNLLPGGRIIFSISHSYLIYNRVEISVNTLLSSWFDHSNRFKKVKVINLLGKTNPGYGDYFFCVDYV